MKRHLRLLTAGTLLLLVACATPQLPPTQWSYEKDAIRMHIKADNRLNLADDEAHTLLLCIYQLSDPNTFNQLSNDDDGLYKLLECSLFGNGAAAAKRLIIQPGQDLNLTLDRAEGARYVAMVAGYSIMDKARMIKMVEIPETIDEKGFLKKTITRKPARLDIDIVLGPQQITTVTESAAKGK